MISIGDRVFFYSARIFPLGSYKRSGIIVDKLIHSESPNSDKWARFKICLDRKILWIFPVYEWVRGGEILGWKSSEVEELERLAKK